MSLPTTQTIIHFTALDTHNPLILGIADISYYPSNFTKTNPTLEIPPPGFNKSVLTYTPSSLNLFNSNDLGITCGDDSCSLTELPDGIWAVKMSVNPPDQYNKSKNFLRTKELERRWGIALMKTDIVNCNGDIKSQQLTILDEIWYYIQCAIGAANDCNYKVSINLYREALEMLKDFTECKPNSQFYLAGL